MERIEFECLGPRWLKLVERYLAGFPPHWIYRMCSCMPRNFWHNRRRTTNLLLLLVWIPLPGQVEVQIVGELARKWREKIVQPESKRFRHCL